MWKRVEGFDKEKWNEFVTKNGPQSGRFLQSWEWGEFQKAVGEKVVRFISDNGVASVVIRFLPGFGSYAYCPQWPITDSSQQWSDAAIEIASSLTSFVPRNDTKIVIARPQADMSTDLSAKASASAEASAKVGAIANLVFARFDVSILQNVSQNIDFITHPAGSVMKLGKNWIKTIDVSPSRTWITDLDKSEEELFVAIHKKTRYNIGLAQRNNLRVEIGSKDFEKVWSLFESTSTRGQFRLHNKSHYKKLLDVAFLAVVWKDNEPIAANIMIDFAEVRTYLHGASSHEHRALMAPHLLHWELIKDAKQKGLKKYDWWGVAPEDQPNHPWVGISRFKKSFPGREVVYVGTYDFVIKPFWYNLYRLVRKLRRAI